MKRTFNIIIRIGIVGMILGVPFFAAIYTLVSQAVEKRMEKKKAKKMAEAEAAAESLPPTVEEEPAPVQKE